MFLGYGRKVKKLTPEPGTVVRVYWHDCFTEDKWTALATLLNETRCTMETVGFYMGKSAGNWVIPSGLDSSHNGGATWFIPEVLISSWETL